MIGEEFVRDRIEVDVLLPVRPATKLQERVVSLVDGIFQRRASEDERDVRPGFDRRVELVRRLRVKIAADRPGDDDPGDGGDRRDGFEDPRQRGGLVRGLLRGLRGERAADGLGARARRGVPPTREVSSRRADRGRAGFVRDGRDRGGAPRRGRRGRRRVSARGRRRRRRAEALPQRSRAPGEHRARSLSPVRAACAKNLTNPRDDDLGSGNFRTPRERKSMRRATTPRSARPIPRVHARALPNEARDSNEDPEDRAPSHRTSSTSANDEGLHARCPSNAKVGTATENTQRWHQPRSRTCSSA